jgi:HK97 family phage major capsid protein
MPDNGIAEVKELFGKTEKAVSALRSEFDELKGRVPEDVVTAEKIGKIEAEIATRLTAEADLRQKQAEKIADLEAALARPGAAGAAGPSEDEVKAASAFNAYLRKGDETELKAMGTTTAEGGGFLAPGTMSGRVRDRLRRTSPVRDLCTVIPGIVSYYEDLVERDDAGSGWVGETESRTETSTPTIEMIRIDLNEVYAMPKASQRLLDMPDFDLEGWLTRKITERLRRQENAAFIAGSGVKKPKGITAYATADSADAARASATLEHVATGTSGAFDANDPADVLIDAFYALQAEYQANATWLMKNTTAAAVAKMQDGQGQYLLQGVLNGDGQIVRTIHGRPMVLADDMPAIAANSLSIAVGDLEAGYTIIEGAELSILRDPYSTKGFVLFYTRKPVGGGVSDFDAIKLVKFA